MKKLKTLSVALILALLAAGGLAISQPYGPSGLFLGARTPNIVIFPPATIGTTVPINAPPDGGSHSYTVLTGDLTGCVSLAATYTTLAVPQATGIFGSGSSFCVITKSAITATSTTSKVNNIAGATGLKLGANAQHWFVSDGTDWWIAVGVPTATSQDGSTYLKNDGTYGTPGGGGGVTCESGSFTAIEGHCLWKQDVSAASSIVFGSLTKDDYRIHCDNLLPSAGTNTIVVQLNSDTGGTYTTKGPEGQGISLAFHSSTTDTGFFAFGNVDTSGIGYNLDGFISGVSRAVKKVATGSLFAPSGATLFSEDHHSFSSTASAATSITIKDTSGGTTLTGRCTLESLGPT
jgi:hypothetical protein